MDSRESALLITLIIWAAARQFLASTLVRVTLCSVLQRLSNPQVSPPSRRGVPRRLAADQMVYAGPMGIHTRDAYVHLREPHHREIDMAQTCQLLPPGAGLQACATRPGEKRVWESFLCQLSVVKMIALVLKNIFTCVMCDL